MRLKSEALTVPSYRVDSAVPQGATATLDLPTKRNIHHPRPPGRRAADLLVPRLDAHRQGFPIPHRD